MKNTELNSDLKQQMDHELKTWQRTLDYMLQENIHLKNRLADIIRTVPADGLIAAIEAFQHQFINKDTLIAFLRRDITAQMLSDNRNIKEHDKLRRDVELMEKEFNRLKFDFNMYVTRNLIDHL